MKIIPIEKLTLTSGLSKSDIIEELNANVRPNQHFQFGIKTTQDDKKFEGKIFEDHFCIKRIINYQNSFLPEIKGELIEKLNGTEIQLVLKPITFIMVFMSIWFGTVSLVLIGSLIGFAIGETPIAACLIPLFMLLVGFGILKFGFSTESEKSKDELIKILQAKIKSAS